MPTADPAPTGGPEPLVRCLGCGRAWHGAIVAHGLKIAGHCPRCSSELSFRAGAAARMDDPPASAEPDSDLPPWQILGVTTTWDR